MSNNAVRTFVKTPLRKLGRRLGFKFGTSRKIRNIPKDIDSDAIKIIESVEPYTLLDWERLFAFIAAVRYVARHKIQGAVVECGVWRGGSIAAAALALKATGDSRPMYLFDTFEGMSAPEEMDKKVGGNSSAIEQFAALKTGSESSDWHRATVEDVAHNLATLGLARDDFHFIKGMVENTIPGHTPAEGIAVLRLDTDWYKSTKHELEHLFPELTPGGVLIIDDYGAWEGSRRAVDEYLEANNIRILLTRVRDSAIGIKQG